MTTPSWPPPQRPARLPEGPSPAEVNQVVSLFNTGGFVEAERLAQGLTRRFPRHGFGWKVLGAALKQQGRLGDALAPMRKAAEIGRTDAEAFSNLGLTLLQLGQLAEAETALGQAIRLKPAYAQAHSNLGAVLMGLGRPEEAEASYRKTAELAPAHADAHSNLGLALLAQGRLDEAEAALRRALAVDPGYVRAHSNLGTLLVERGRDADGARVHRRAWALAPRSLAQAARAHLLMPAIPESREATAAWRARYVAGIAALEKMALASDEGEPINTSAFYLAFHGEDDRTLLEGLSRLFRAKMPALGWTSPHLAAWKAPDARRIKVGFLSEFLYLHTIGELFQGLIRRLDREKFEVVILHVGRSLDDEFRQELDIAADHALVLPPDLAGQQKAIAEQTLDVLFYPDIGLTPATSFLAYARLAPVQAVGVGHPETTGLGTVDYFVSAEATEPDGADAHYSERLIRLSRMPTFYRPPQVPTDLPSREALGLPATGTLYGCPQSLFKIHPDFDAILAAIAEGDPDGRIVLLHDINPSWSELLRQRWKDRFPTLDERTIFLGRLPDNGFPSLLTHLDVGLDPIHFGGGNFFYEAMAVGLPTVTWSGPFMRGRIAAGAYRQMGIADAPVVSRLEDYAPLALALGRDPERRKAIRAASVAAASRELYEDRQAVRDLEAFFEAAVAAAGRGERLPEGWRPPAGA